VQRLFSMFPRGLPGLALLLLRVSAAVALLLNCYFNRSEISSWIQLVTILVAATICIGFMTPVAAATALVFHVFVWLGLGGISAAALIVVVLDAVALALLGPGAYSLDAFRFGRRVVVLQPP